MAKLSKRMKKLCEQGDFGHAHKVVEALELVKKTRSAKFEESVDVAIKLGVDARKSEHNVRGALVLPEGTGRTTRVACFVTEADVDKAKEAGADRYDFDALIEEIKQGKLDFDVCIATPQAMPKLTAVSRILGPRGLMPNPKVGTVTTDLASVVAQAKAGRVQYRIDKAGIVHCAIGLVTFEIEALKNNLFALVAVLIKSKPATAKGTYIQSMSLSLTMGPAVSVDRSSLPSQ